MNNIINNLTDLIKFMQENGYDSLGLSYDPEMMIGIANAAKERFLDKHDPNDWGVWKDSLDKFKEFFIDSDKNLDEEELKWYDESRSLIKIYSIEIDQKR